MTYRPYPDYGILGAPNMDPHYISPEEEKRLEDEHQQTIEDFRETLQNVVNDESGNLTPEEIFDVLFAVMHDLKLTPRAA